VVIRVGRALAGFILGALLVLAAIGFAMHYGLLPSGIKILQVGTSGSSSSSSSSASSGSTSSYSGSAALYSGNGTAAGVVGAAVGYVFDKLGSLVMGSKQLVASFFNWLLGSSLYDAVINLVVVVIVAGVLYWLLKFFKWIIAIVVAIDALLIILKYVLMVI